MSKSLKPPARRARQHSRTQPKPNGSHANGNCAELSTPTLDSPNVNGGAPACGSLGQNGSAPALTRDDLWTAINTKITNAAPAIVDKIIHHAQEHASYLHAKFLFDFAGLSAAPAPASNSAEHSLAALLLRALEIPAPLPAPAAEHSSAPAHPTELHD